MPLRHWKPEYLRSLPRIRTFKGLLPIGLYILSDMYANGCRNIEMICGPLTTGERTIGENFRRFEIAIAARHRAGRDVFNLMPFERVLRRLYLQWRETHPDPREYCHPILQEVYGPLIQEGPFDSAAFIPGWDRSFGAKFEWSQFNRKPEVMRIKLPETMFGPLPEPAFDPVV